MALISMCQAGEVLEVLSITYNLAMDLENELSSQGYALHRWSNGPDFWYPVHDHPYAKVIVVLKGTITFYLPAEKREMILNAGDRLEIPPRTEHSASAGPSGVTCLEGQRI